MTMNDGVTQTALRNFADQAFEALAKQTFQALVDESGVPDAMASMKTYKNRNAYILLCMVKKRLHLKGNTIDTLITPMALAQAGLGGGENVHQEIKEKGAVCYVDKCPFQDTSPEFCVVISHFTTDLICEALNPEYECIWTHHLTNGDPYCRYIYRKKAGPYSNIEDLGKTLATIPRIAIPKEDERELKDFILANWLDAVIETFNDLHGSDKTLEILVPLAKKIGLEGGKFLAEENPGMKNDAITICHLVNVLGQVLMQHGSVQYLSNDELRKEITDCPFQIFPYEMCKVLEGLLQGVIESINPDLDYSYDKMMTKGDSICCWHVRSRGTPPIMIQEEKAKVVDPLAILKLRLAKGEINKGEYEEIRALISP